MLTEKGEKKRARNETIIHTFYMTPNESNINSNENHKRSTAQRFLRIPK